MPLTSCFTALVLMIFVLASLGPWEKRWPQFLHLSWEKSC